MTQFTDARFDAEATSLSRPANDDVPF
jgi:hypothetical protein